MNKKIYKIEGMDCPSCAMVIEGELEDIGVLAKCSYAKQVLEIEDSGSVDEKRIKEVVEKEGYKIVG